MTHVVTPDERKWSTGNILVGLVLIVLGVFSTVVYAVERDDRLDADVQQENCLVDQFQKLNTALDARAKTAEKESAAVRRIWDLYGEAAGLVKDDPTQELKPKDEARLQVKLVDALLDYQKVQDDITEERKENPIPPYPAGACDPKE